MEDRIVLPADMEALYDAISFVSDKALEAGAGLDGRRAAELAAEEIFVNIVNYAYPVKKEDVEITCGLTGDDFTVTFKDRGIPFDPTGVPEPDTSMPAAKRPVGGLGIYLVKNYMDGISYQRTRGYNILTVSKHIKERSI